MNLPEHSLLFTSEQMRKSARRWLMLGVAALGLAGIFAGMLANTKSAYFFTALVAHVDLSVLVWFLAFSCLLMALEVPWGALATVGEGGFISVVLGTLLIAASAFSGGVPFQNNYVPVIYHPLFFMGLALLFAGVLCVVGQLLYSFKPKAAMTPVRAGVVSVATLLVMAAFCFIWSFHKLPGEAHDQTYYEHVFWAGGHVLQIAYAQLMMIAWMWLAESAGVKLKFGRGVVLTCYGLGVLTGCMGVLLSLVYAPATLEHRNAFTMLMKHGNGLPSIIMGAGLMVSLFGSKNVLRLPVICLVMSMLLFAVGGGLGYLIAGSTVTTPAHYHGSIVGVTLALMGLAYMLLPKIGYAGVENNRWAAIQPVLYGGGQLCWMAGMAIGGYQGVGRKIAGSAEVIGGFGGFLKHGGDGLSLIGGLLFVFVVLRAVWKRPAR